MSILNVATAPGSKPDPLGYSSLQLLASSFPLASYTPTSTVSLAVPTGADYDLYMEKSKRFIPFVL